MAEITPAHDQTFRHTYLLHYPAHEPRKGDPHYVDFEEYRRRTRATATCAHAATQDCGGELELHHAHIEFALANAVDLTLLEGDYPGVSDPNTLGAWVESGANLIWLCERHHRGIAGVHSVAASDWEASKYIRGLVGEAPQTKEDKPS
jgi:hypothetical protein